MSDSDRAQRQHAQLLLINDIAERIGAAVGLEGVLDRVVELVQERFGVHHVGYLTVHGKQEELAMRAKAGDFAHLFPLNYRLRLDQGIAGWVGTHGETVLANDVTVEARYVALPPGVKGTRSQVCVPVRVGEELVGVLDVQSAESDAFDEHDVLVLETLASQVGVATENARLYASIQQASAERRRADEALWESEKRFRAIAETADDAMVVFDRRENIFFWNSAAKSIFGYEAGETQGKVLDSIVSPRFREVLREEMGQVVAKKKADLVGMTKEMGGIRKDGREFPVELSLATWRTKEEVFFTVIARDITERKQAEKELKQHRDHLEEMVEERTTKLKTAVEWLQREVLECDRVEQELRNSLQEKEVLLKEIHHRVKNNLQVISSLLNLQAGTIEDPDAVETLKESQSRIRSMAFVHESLYQSDNLSEVDLGRYIHVLTTHLFRTYKINTSLISLDIDAEDAGLSVDATIPCGLIINELISNSLKYAFPGGREGRIYVDLHSENGQLTLIAGDDGVGFAEDVDFRNTESLGLQLVNTLVDQIDGTIELNGKEGTEFRITFPRQA